MTTSAPSNIFLLKRSIGLSLLRQGFQKESRRDYSVVKTLKVGEAQRGLEPVSLED